MTPGKRLLVIGLCLPAVLLVLAPVLTMLWLSFSQGRFPTWPWPGWSLEWYAELFRDEALQASMARSVGVGLSSAVLAVALGFPAGYWLARMPEGRGLRWLLVLTIPAVVPLVLFGVCFLEFTRSLGLARTLTAVTLGHVVIFCPLATALCYHRCRQLNVEIENAARELGASETRILLQVVGLQMWRTVVASLIVVFVLSWDEYIVSWFVSGFDKTYPVFVRNLLESTLSPEINAVGVLVAVGSCGVIALATLLLRRG
jgi:spermidine/putrescine transport system permease protein